MTKASRGRQGKTPRVLSPTEKKLKEAMIVYVSEYLDPHTENDKGQIALGLDHLTILTLARMIVVERERRLYPQPASKEPAKTKRTKKA